MLLPVLQPAELWQRTGPLRDRRAVQAQRPQGLADYVLAMTHEESITFHIAREVRSYRELPKILYHVQVKERDEPRPRAGVLRTREFTMKDSYSFDRDDEGLDASYELHRRAYARILDRCGVRWYEVESDVGMMGGSAAHEYMAPVARRARTRSRSRPATRRTSRSPRREPQPVELPPPLDEPREVPTPGLTTVDEVAGALGVVLRGRAEGDPRDRRGPRHGPGAGPRRPPPQRDQAHQRARRRVPPGDRRRRSRRRSGRRGSSAPSAPRCP